MRLIVLFLYIFVSMVSNGQAVSSNTSECGENKPTQNVLVSQYEQEDPFEFQLTDAEVLEASRWKDKSFDDMWHDALNCDRAALYMVGLCFLTGSSGLTIDVEKADFCFERSASFGFSPSIKQIFHKHIEEDNPFLALVYCNILVSLGHKEFMLPYHEFRKKALDNFGVGIVKEIERLAACKSELINDNMDKLNKIEDKKNLFFEMTYNGMLINWKDKELDMDYWVRFSNFQVEADKEAARFQKILKEYYNNFQKLYERSRKNLKNALDRLENNNKLKELESKGLKEAIKAKDFAEKFIVALDSFKNAPNDNLRSLSAEFSLLCQNVSKALEQHYKFFLSPDNFLSSDRDLETLVEYQARIDVHRENIRDTYEKNRRRL